MRKINFAQIFFLTGVITMSRDVEYIQNVTAFAFLDQRGEFSMQGGFPTNPDEVVIRQVTYDSADAAKVLYLIHSNINNSIIGCIGNTNGFASNPGTRIQTKNPLPNVLTFKIMLGLVPAGVAVEFDQITICMDFIKYK